MQGTTIKLLTGGLLMVAAAGYVQAEALQPDLRQRKRGADTGQDSTSHYSLL